MSKGQPAGEGKFNNLQQGQYRVEVGTKVLDHVRSIDLPDEKHEKVESENGRDQPVQEAMGRTTYTDLTIEVALFAGMQTDGDKLWNEFESAEQEAKTDDAKVTVTIDLYDSSGKAKAFDCQGAFVYKYEGPSLQAGQTSEATETFHFKVDNMKSRTI